MRSIILDREIETYCRYWKRHHTAVVDNNNIAHDSFDLPHSPTEHDAQARPHDAATM